MNMQTSLFWFTGAAFFVVQLGILLALMRQSRCADLETAANGRLEIVWTLVPASLIAALALMLGGLTTGSWTDSETPIAAAPGITLRWAGPENEPSAERRR
ncbi:MAG: hypothetical protein P8R42_17780 [Candidatus Binatia bacterium]|nr:hypothetical protein [Candidatus Binatia bacterium]